MVWQEKTLFSQKKTINSISIFSYFTYPMLETHLMTLRFLILRLNVGSLCRAICTKILPCWKMITDKFKMNFSSFRPLWIFGEHVPFTTTTFCQEGTITSRRCLNDAKTCLWIVWGGTGSVSTDFQWSPFIWKFIIYEECYSLFEKKLIFKRKIQVHFVTRVELFTYVDRNWKPALWPGKGSG